MALPQTPVFQLRIIFVIKNKKQKRRKSLGAGGRTLYEAALFSFLFNPLVNLDSLPLFYTSSVKLRLQYFVPLFTNLAWTSATMKEEYPPLQKRGRSSLYPSWQLQSYRLIVGTREGSQDCRAHHPLTGCPLESRLRCHDIWHPDTGMQTGLTWRSTHSQRARSGPGSVPLHTFPFWVAHFPRCPWSNWFHPTYTRSAGWSSCVCLARCLCPFHEDMFMEDTLVTDEWLAHVLGEGLHFYFNIL